MPKIKHGLSHTREYRIWTGMKARVKRDPNYIKKNITVCDRWQKFENFYADMGPCPEGLTIERKNNNGNYEPSNCKWATYAEQNRNLSTNVLVDGVVLADKIKQLGMSRTTVDYRLKQNLDLSAPLIQDRLFCKKGHPWNEENTYNFTTVNKGKVRMQRYCRKCRALAATAFRSRLSND
jgi:hypothetical protein